MYCDRRLSTSSGHSRDDSISDNGRASEKECNGLFDAVTCTIRLTTNTMLQKANIDADNDGTSPMVCWSELLSVYIYVKSTYLTTSHQKHLTTFQIDHHNGHTAHRLRTRRWYGNVKPATIGAPIVNSVATTLSARTV
jgi:hypothetical protein